MALAEPVSEPDSQARTVLVVDDDALIAMSTVNLLEDLGHTVLEANSGAAALKIIESGKHVDIRITDYARPRMNGGELGVAVRKRRPDLPILLATGYAELPAGSEIGCLACPSPIIKNTLSRPSRS